MGIEIRLLGGFLVSHEEGRPHFESQKVRALLAYLACHRDVELSRDHLAELLWPEADPDSARRNLRQALYNLRQGLGEGDGAEGERIDGLGSRAVRLRLADDDLLDVEAFLDGWRAGMQGSGDVVAAELVRAADLYRGDFLTGFTVRDSPAFDDWVVTEQERLRDAVVQVLRALADHFAARGEYDTAITYTRRLLDVDPLAEEAHRELMRLYVLSGRRRRALYQFQELERLLDRELGVEPMDETRALYEAVQSDSGLETPAPAEPARPAAPRVPLGPFVVMEGREESLAALEQSWRAAARGRARLALVEGESGIGKTRLIKTFLNAISSRHQATIVRGRPLYAAPWSAAEPLLGALQGLRIADEEEGEEALPNLSGPVAGHLGKRLGERWARRRKGSPVILFLEDLHLASESVVDAVVSLLEGFAESPLWIVAGSERGSLERDHPVRRLGEADAVDRVPLARLDDPHVIAVCRHLVGDDDSDRLARHLFRASEGLPLAMVENINALCDLGLLVPVNRKRWGLEADPPPVEATAEEMARLVVERVDRLPSSTRRLISLAAVIGPVFDVDLLQRVSREHIGVVEIGIELMLERWLIRQRARRWSDDPRERDLVLWAQGARRGAFEFAHPAIHAAIYQDLAIHRRRSLHRQLADSLAERYEPAETRAADLVARHYLLADDPAQALPYFTEAVKRATDLGDAASAAMLREQALGLFDQVEAEAGEAAKEGWRELRREFG